MIKFGIIGCGRIATRHASHIDKLGVLVAVCDIKPERAESLASEYEARAYIDIDEMLSNETEIDLVAVCSPNGLHAEHVIACLNKGFHVLCEKPMALSTHDCGEMIKAAEKNNKRLFIVKQNRFNPAVAEVKNIIEDGILGKIFSVQLSCFWNRNENYYANSDWKGSKALDGGTLFTQFSHFVDLLYWMIGDISKARAIVNNFAHDTLIDFEDTGAVILQFANGAIGTINYTVNSFQKNMEGSLTIFGEKGTVKIGGQYLNKLEYQQIQDYTIGELPVGNPANEYGDYQGSMSNHDKVYENVIDVLENKGTIVTNSFEGLKTVEIIEKIYSSVESPL